MKSQYTLLISTILAMSTSLGVSMRNCFAQASFIEDFETAGTVGGGQHGPSGLISDGWVFRNQSDPVGSGDWSRSAWAYQGNWSLFVDVTVSFWDGNNAEASSWAILPPVPDQISGDSLRFFYFNTQAPPLVPAGHMEIRYSPTGGTNTGSNSDDVGDFTQLLSDIPATEQQWTEHTIELPGSGRLALRYHVPPSESQADFWGSFEIDNLSVGPASAPCTQPTAPGAGETVTWTAAGGPYEVCENFTIPADATVIIEAGTVLNFQTNTTINLQGTMLAQGTQSAPIVFAGPSNFPPIIQSSGTLSLDFVEVFGQLKPQNGDLLASNCTFTAPGIIFGSADYMEVFDCQFDDAALYASADTMLVRNSTFENTYVSTNGSLLLLDGVTVNNSPVDGINIIGTEQALFLHDVTVTNSAGAGLKLVAGNFVIDSSVNLQGNLYPVLMGGSGILPGSSVQSSGNLNNHIAVESMGAGASRMVWTNAGVPYVIGDASYTGGSLLIKPGVNIKLGPNTTFWGEPGFVRVRGLPQSPVVIERLDPAQSWQGLQYFNRIENCIIDGGQIGARFHSSTGPGYLDNCIIRNCDFGTQNDAIVRKTRFFDNGTGSWGNNWPSAMDGGTGANSFEGNGVAIDSTGFLIDAQNNWWGDPSGPSTPSNPGGAGDSILGAGVSFEPYRTTPPDFTDNPPIVNLNKNFFLLEPGSKIIVSWDSSDDGGVVSHRIEFDHPLEGVSVVADDLPGTQQAFEWIVPDIGFAVNNKAPVLRVTAIDSAGQEGWDEQAYLIPTGDVQGTLTITTDLTEPFTAGQDAGTLCWTAEGTNPLGFTVDAAIYFDGDSNGQGLGGVTSYLQCLSGTMDMPLVSTDTGRVALVIQESLNNVKYFFSDYYTIRPDARTGDEPPVMTLLTPGPGDTFAGGTTVPVSWTATDDQGVRSIDVQASYDAGRTWHFIASDLPGSTTSFLWQLPPSTGFADVRVRVMARDLTFQSSSDGMDVVFSISAGSGSVAGDIDGNGVVDMTDIAMFVDVLTGIDTDPARMSASDFNGDGSANGQDIALLLGLMIGN